MEKVMKEEIKSKLSTYAVGGVGGAIIVLILGFWVGPLTTNGAVAEAVDGAIVEQQALFCAERARLDPSYVNAAAFGERDSNAQRDFATRFAAFEGQTTSSTRAVVNACRGLLEEV
jgi:hypothetical protein